MKRRLLAAAAITMLLTAPAFAKDTLYKQLGGYDALAAVTDTFLGKLATDPQLGRFFIGHSTDSNKRIRQSIVEFLCEKTGGPCFYTGRDMATAHKGLKISEKDWNASATLLVATLNDLKVPKPLQDQVLTFVVSLKPDIVAK